MVLLINDYSKYNELVELVECILWSLCGSILRYSLSPIEPLTYGVIIEATEAIRDIGYQATQLYKAYVAECAANGVDAQSPQEALTTMGYDPDKFGLLYKAMDSDYVKP